MSDLGCFGMPSVLNLRSRSCQECPDGQACARLAHQILGRIAPVVGAQDRERELRLHLAGVPPLTPTVLSDAQLQAVARAPKKVAERARALLERGFDRTARAQFLAGINPFERAGAKELFHAGELLLRGGFTRGELRMRCMECQGWAAATAASQVSQAVALLEAIGLTEESSDRTIRLKA